MTAAECLHASPRNPISWKVEGMSLTPTDGADFSNLRIGTTVTPAQIGADEIYAVNARRCLQKVWSVEFKSQTDCDEWAYMLMMVVKELCWRSANSPSVVAMNAVHPVRVVHFDEETGAVIDTQEFSQ
jgi:hypothetical protein